jgi:hypothetical protein
MLSSRVCRVMPALVQQCSLQHTLHRQLLSRTEYFYHYAHAASAAPCCATYTPLAALPWTGCMQDHPGVEAS